MRTVAASRPWLRLVAGATLLVLALFAALPPDLHREAAITLLALCTAWALRRRLLRYATCLWCCLTPPSRVAVLVVACVLIISWPTWVEVPIVISTMVGAGALNRAREARTRRLIEALDQRIEARRRQRGSATD